MVPHILARIIAAKKYSVAAQYSDAGHRVIGNRVVIAKRFEENGSAELAFVIGKCVPGDGGRRRIYKINAVAVIVRNVGIFNDVCRCRYSIRISIRIRAIAVIDALYIAAVVCKIILRKTNHDFSTRMNSTHLHDW